MEPRRQEDDKVQKEEKKQNKQLPKMNSISGKTDLPK